MCGYVFFCFILSLFIFQNQYVFADTEVQNVDDFPEKSQNSSQVALEVNLLESKNDNEEFGNISFNNEEFQKLEEKNIVDVEPEIKEVFEMNITNHATSMPTQKSMEDTQNENKSTTKPRPLLRFDLCKPPIPECDMNMKYSKIDGSCNNENNPTWGMANTFYKRMAPAAYGDGISTPRRSRSNKELPNARLLSRQLFSNYESVDPIRSLLAMQFGQFVANDMSHIMKIHVEIDCCSESVVNTTLYEEICYPIKYPGDDSIVLKSGISCQDFIRTGTDKMMGCDSNENSVAHQINAATAFLDLSQVYGSDERTSHSLRSMVGGMLLYERRNGTIFPPTGENLESCLCNKWGHRSCYKTGDSRSNQNPHLVILHTIFLKEHNRIADELKLINPGWDDETLFQEARRINIAQYQHIVYYEWLPEILGWKNLLNTHIIFPNSLKFIEDYQPKVQPSVINSHATAAFRHLNSQITGKIHLMDAYDSIKSTEPLNEWINRPELIENFTVSEQLTRGLISQRCEMSDKNLADEIINSVYKCSGKSFLEDVKASDIQRDRDHGLGYYNDYRELCSISNATSFDDFLDYIPKDSVEMLKELYESHKDVDLSVGGSLEKHWNGALFGPTFLCILLQQFKHTRISDRYFYEHQSAGFTLDQLLEIKQTSISKMLCDNADGIKEVQMNSFLNLPEEALIPCELLPGVDLSKWKEVSVKKKKNSAVRINH